MRLEGKVALVIGAGKGIGQAVAEKFASEGCRVAVSDIEASYARYVAERIDDKLRRTEPMNGDVASPQQVEAMFQQTVKKFGHIDIVVNCAGWRENVPLRLLEEQLWDRTLDIHLKGCFNCAQCAEKYMVEQLDGRIIFFSSPVPSPVTGHGSAHYDAANAGIEGLTRTLARELGPYNLRVNCIAADFIDTDLTRRSAQQAGMYLEDFQKLVLALVPLRRMGRPEEVADLALFLASDESSFLTGQVISLKGGP